MAKIANNIELNISEKTRYTINGNKDKYIELNPGDAGIIARLGDMIPVINGLVSKYETLMDSESSVETLEEDMASFSTNFKTLDSELRDIVNTLFDYDVCSVCASGGSMFDPYGGEYRYAVIITTLLGMYEDTLSKEMNKLLAKMKKHTDKYTPKDHQKKTK